MGRPAGWLKELTGRSAMISPGAPKTRRSVEREFWKQIAAGVSSEDAAAVVGVSSAVGARWFRQGGGMPTITLTDPGGRYLSFAEREEIALLRAENNGVREIARRLSRDPATISRELRRNAATRGGKLEYRASVAQWKAELMARRPKEAKLVTNMRLYDWVQERLDGSVRLPDGTVIDGPVTAAWQGRNKPHRADRKWSTAWSPEQIARRLPVEFPDDESMRISHETIYQSLFIEGRGALKRELVAALRTGRALRKPRARSQSKPQGHVTADVVISERPAEAADRAVPGALGGRSDHRDEPVRDRHPRRTLQPLDALGPSSEAGWVRSAAAHEARTCAQWLRRRRDERRVDRVHEHAPGATAQDADLGSREGALRARPVRPGHRHEGVLR